MNDTHIVLQTAGITKNFGQVNALNGIDCKVHAGESLAIMGPSGSGKSTLLHCLSGVLTPSSGQIIFECNDIASMRDTQRSRLRLTKFGFVFQDGQLLVELPARENVALPLQLTGTGRSKALKSADQMLDRLGLAAEKDRLPGDMSGGQAQRVAIARALVTQPTVVFADEPTGSLDQATGHEVMQILTSIVKMNGTSLVIVTHDTQVASWCDRLLEIRDGKIHSSRTLKLTNKEER